MIFFKNLAWVLALGQHHISYVQNYVIIQKETAFTAVLAETDVGEDHKAGMSTEQQYISKNLKAALSHTFK